MNREEAAQMLKRLKYDYQNGADENDCFYDMYLYALDTAITILTSPWVKTSDRLPDKCDYYTMYLTTKKRNGGVWQVRGSFIKEHPELCPWWMPIPPLPEVEE